MRKTSDSLNMVSLAIMMLLPSERWEARESFGSNHAK